MLVTAELIYVHVDLASRASGIPASCVRGSGNSRRSLPRTDRMRIQLGDWRQHAALGEPLRFAVFVEEQSVPAEIELDSSDPVSVHGGFRCR